MSKTNIAIVILHFLLRIPVVFIVPFAMLFASKTDRKTTHYGQDGTMQRYTLPKALKWLLTPDEDLAGGMYEPTVKKIYDKCGWWVCGVYWIGLRNQAQGLLWTRGVEVDENYRNLSKIENPSMEEKVAFKFLQAKYKLQESTLNLGLFKIVFEWEIARDHYLDYTKTGYFAIPNLTFKKA